jgi:hypothetical protein
MFVVCYMLRKVKIDGMYAAHNYPRIQLAYMLSLEHLRSTNHVGFNLLDGHMYMFNEEYGEIYFSLLSRCVLGDHCKSDFDHMDAQYRLLPIYNQVKSDIISETSKSDNSIAWHHIIPTHSSEVVMTRVFFTRVVRKILNNTHMSYPYQKVYGMRDVCTPTLSHSSIPMVYNNNISNEIDGVFADIKRAICTSWMSDKGDWWPDVNGMVSDADESDDSVSSDSRYRSDLIDNKSSVAWGSDWTDCIVGQFAVVQKNFEDGTHGVVVLKIIKKNASDLETNIEMMSFDGMEYVCHIPNNTLSCVSQGRWNYHAGLSVSTSEMNWSVIGYFEKLSPVRRLPADLIRHISSHHDANSLFD